jgi:hypothetical protein
MDCIRESIPTRPLCRKASNLLQLASVRTTLSVRQALGFLSKTQLWEDRCNHPEDLDSHPDALIHKASIVIQIQTSGRWSSWSGRSSIRYGNCVHQINRQDDHPIGPYVRSLDMKITCSGSATVQMIGHHRPDAAQIKKEFQRNFWKADHTVVRPNAL